MSLPTLDQDAVVACADLVGRTGARNFEIGYLHDDVPVEEAGWYAHAQMRGARITEENHRGPTEAADALARRLLTGAQCQGCKGLVTLSDGGAVAYRDAHLADGRRWTAEEAMNAPQCRWSRMGPRWVMGCAGRPDPRAIERLREQGVYATEEELIAAAAKRHDAETMRFVVEAEQRGPGLRAAGWARRRGSGDGIGVWDHLQKGRRIIHSIGRELDGEVWAHVSVSRRDRKLPTWEHARDAWWLVYPDVAGVIVVAPRAEHVDLGEVMHIWGCLTRPAVPDFSMGLGTI